MKGLILCGGRGTRLRPYTFVRPKHLLPIGNRPVVHYVIDNLVAAGIHDIGIVIPPHFSEQFRSAFGEHYLGADITYITQREASGLADAVMQAQEFIADHPFMLCLGDNFIQGDFSCLIKRFQEESLDGMLYVSQVENPSRFGVVSLEGDRVVRVVEKPAVPPSRYAMIGVYALRPALFDTIARIGPSQRGEYELTDALQWMIEHGATFSFELCREWWADAGTPEDLLACNRQVLNDIRKTAYGAGVHVRSSQIFGPVLLEDGAVISDSEIVGPVVVGRGSHVIGSRIGPYSSIAHSVHLAHSTIEQSIVLEGAHIEDLHMVESLIGGSVRLQGVNRYPIRLYAGDHSQMFI